MILFLEVAGALYGCLAFMDHPSWKDMCYCCCILMISVELGLRKKMLESCLKSGVAIKGAAKIRLYSVTDFTFNAVAIKNPPKQLFSSYRF